MSSLATQVAFVISLASLAVYSYSAYYMTSNDNERKLAKILPPQLDVYGQWKFLTFHCLCFQILNAILHVLAHFSRSFVKPRDLVFSSLAYPVGSVVVYSFWAVWHLIGREFIFPTELSKFFPDWINHSIHTIIVPINFILLFLVDHKYSSYGLVVTLGHGLMYIVFLHVIKAQTGYFVYKYLDAMGEIERAVYFVFTALLIYAMYKSGELITAAIHKRRRATAHSAPGKKSKQ